jgi:hypothetical protein
MESKKTLFRTKTEIKAWIRDVLILAETGELNEAIKQLKFLYQNIPDKK